MGDLVASVVVVDRHQPLADALHHLRQSARRLLFGRGVEDAGKDTEARFDGDLLPRRWSRHFTRRTNIRLLK